MKKPSDKAKEIAANVVALHNANLEYPKLMHMSDFTRYNRYFLTLALEHRDGSSLVDAYDAAEILQNKYGPEYYLPKVRTNHTFS